MSKSPKFLLSSILFFSLAVQAATKAVEAPARDTVALDKFFFDQNDTGVRKGKRTDGALILEDGHVIYEKYGRGYDENKKHIMWSTSKTALALLFGVAEKDGFAKRSQSICDFVEHLRPEVCAIKVQDLLQWSSGLTWREEYENAPTPRVSSVLAMLYGEGAQDMAKFVLDQPLLATTKPGLTWRYSSGDSIALAAVLRGVYKGQDLREVFAKKLYGPLGMKDWLWESDNAGTLSGGYYFFVSPRDLAKLGGLFMSDGAVGEGKNKQQIVSKDFITFMRTAPESFKTNRADYSDGKNISGAHLWVNDPAGTGLAKPWPEAPDDTVATLGHWGQFMIVIPSLKVIAVRTGDTRDHSLGASEFVGQVMAFIHRTTYAKPIEQKPPEKKIDKEDSHHYRDGIMTLGLRFTAKNFCSCLFVSENSEEKCRDYASLEQVSPRLSVDKEKKQTSSSLFYFFKETASYKGPTMGCVLD